MTLLLPALTCNDTTPEPNLILGAQAVFGGSYCRKHIKLSDAALVLGIMLGVYLCTTPSWSRSDELRPDRNLTTLNSFTSPGGRRRRIESHQNGTPQQTSTHAPAQHNQAVAPNSGLLHETLLKPSGLWQVIDRQAAHHHAS